MGVLCCLVCFVYFAALFDCLVDSRFNGCVAFGCFATGVSAGFATASFLRV